MSLYIDVRVNDKVVATAAIANLSDLADTSDYAVSVTEQPSKFAPYLNRQWLVKDHKRMQSVWALVAKVANTAALIQTTKSVEKSDNTPDYS